MMRTLPFISHCNPRRLTCVALVLAVTGALFSVGLVENQVTQHLAQPQPLKVSINQSLALNFTVPIKRAAVANDKVAGIAVISPRSVVVTGKSFGFTQLLLWDERDGQILYDVRVDADITRLKTTIRESMPRANVNVTTILDTVILSGTVPDAPTAERITALAKVFSAKVQNQMAIAGNPQVMLRATVAEVSRQATKALGLNGAIWGTDAFGGSNLNLINPTAIGLQSNRLLPIATPNNFQVMGNGITPEPSTTLYFGLPRTQMELFLQAMQTDGLIKVLAEPNLVAISGQSAEFLAGGELPIPTPSENGISITFREFGVRLNFQPVVQAGDMIRMTVLSEVSEPDYTNAVQIAGYTVPGINKRRAKTVVEVGSGQTFAIAGLLSDHIRGIISKVPGAGHLPVLGALFRSVKYERAESELLILITPDLASPLNPNEVNYVPGQNIDGPNDWELYGLGLLQHDKTDTAACGQSEQPKFNPPGPLCGPWGPQQIPGSVK
jgi:pilus assembly protein CpaC